MERCPELRRTKPDTESGGRSARGGAEGGRGGSPSPAAPPRARPHHRSLYPVLFFLVPSSAPLKYPMWYTPHTTTQLANRAGTQISKHGGITSSQVGGGRAEEWRKGCSPSTRHSASRLPPTSLFVSGFIILSSRQRSIEIPCRV